MITSINVETGEISYLDVDAPTNLPSSEESLLKWRASTKVSRFQAKAALLQMGLLSTANSAVAEADALTQLAWEEAVEFARNSPTIQAMAPLLNLSDEQLDELFILAQTIKA